MIIQVDCAGNLGLVHALFRELGRADAVNTSTKDQQLVGVTTFFPRRIPAKQRAAPSQSRR
jgi:hypothetical protein